MIDPGTEVQEVEAGEEVTGPGTEAEKIQEEDLRKGLEIDLLRRILQTGAEVEKVAGQGAETGSLSPLRRGGETPLQLQVG